MSEERMTVNLEDFIKYLSTKWILIAVISGICALIFWGVANFFGKEIVVEPSERFIYLSQQEAEVKEYMENSIVMEMDASNIFEKTISINNISDMEQFIGYIESGNLWGIQSEKISLEYLMELIAWNVDEKTKILELKIRHSDELGCAEYTEIVATELEKCDPDMGIDIGPQEIVSDENVLSKQLWKINLQEDLQGALVCSGWLHH